jgi:hypothetical protein
MSRGMSLALRDRKVCYLVFDITRSVITGNCMVDRMQCNRYTNTTTMRPSITVTEPDAVVIIILLFGCGSVVLAEVHGNSAFLHQIVLFKIAAPFEQLSS